MRILKNGEQIGKLTVENGKLTCNCNWNKLTVPEMIQLEAYAFMVDPEKVNTNSILVEFKGPYPTQEEFDKAKQFAKEHPEEVSKPLNVLYLMETPGPSK